jgi:hypothetical protein
MKKNAGDGTLSRRMKSSSAFRVPRSSFSVQRSSFAFHPSALIPHPFVAVDSSGENQP